MANHSKERENGVANADEAGKKLIILAGGTGNLGQNIAVYLIDAGASVRALVRTGSSTDQIANLRKMGAIIQEVDYNDPEKLMQGCIGGSCIVSALSGVRDVIVDLQTKLLHAALGAGVPRFIPSDYCIDYTKLAYGTNRNLDLRREFAERLDNASIKATSILNGMFTDLLTGAAPVILFGLKRVVYWGNADQLLDFTTMDNTALFTARAALDNTTPRFLRIAGEVTNIHGLKRSASEATGRNFKLFRAGGLGGLQRMIKITRALFPKKDEVFPPWQGMQYLHNMFSGLPKLNPRDNDRYDGLQWTSVREVLEKRAE
ncbi:MAG: NmrA family NAD(P)-binding protein [Chitinophagaceae bacterium]